MQFFQRQGEEKISVYLVMERQDFVTFSFLLTTDMKSCISHGRIYVPKSSFFPLISARKKNQIKATIKLKYFCLLLFQTHICTESQLKIHFFCDYMFTLNEV